MICFRGARPRNALDGDQLEYGVYEQYEQDTERKALAIRSPALPDDQPASGEVHARGRRSRSGGSNGSLPRKRLKRSRTRC
jgi:hypothetical protein